MAEATKAAFAAGARDGTSPFQGEGCGSSPTAAIQTFSPRELLVRPTQPISKIYYLPEWPFWWLWRLVGANAAASTVLSGENI